MQYFALFPAGDLRRYVIFCYLLLLSDSLILVISFRYLTFLNRSKTLTRGKKSQLSPDTTDPHKISLNLYCIGAMVLLTLGQGNP
jgi:hypothetical protein